MYLARVGGDLVWEWAVPAGEPSIRVSARLDPVQDLESVYVGQRLVSRARIGTKPDGHTVPPPPVAEGYRTGAPPTLVVIHDAVRGGFVLQANGQLVPPISVPAPTPAPRPTMEPSVMLQRSVKVLVVGVLVVALIFAVRHVRADAHAGGSMLAATRLVRLHYPAGFDVRKETAVATDAKPGPDGTYAKTPTSVISAFDRVRDEGIFAVSAKPRGILMIDTSNPWRLGHALNDELEKQVEANLERTFSLHETAWEEATCAGQKGAAITSTFSDGKESGTLWSCSFFHAGNAYMLGYIVNEKSAVDAPQLRALVDQMELLTPR